MSVIISADRAEVKAKDKPEKKETPRKAETSRKKTK